MAKDETGRISINQIEYVAELAKLDLTESEKIAFTDQLNNILDYFKILDEADTRNVQPMFSVLELRNVWREDVEKPCLLVDEALENTPRLEKGFVKAPKIV